MSSPRDIEPRIDWHDSNAPSGSGMCAQHTWHSLGGDYGNPPSWGCSDANACVDKVKASGRYWTPDTWSGPPPRGAWVGWKYGSNGHAALSLGDGRIMTTDPSNGAWTGVEPLDYPTRWGFNPADGDYTVWTDQYNGVRFNVGTEDAEVSAYEYWYSGKPGGVQVVETGYETLDDSVYDPKNSGWESTYVYLNVKPLNWRNSDTRAGILRLRIVRADGDSTGHHDFVIARDSLDEDGHTLLHTTYWEAGDGKQTKVQLKCEGGLTRVELHTRYTKHCVVLK